MVTHTYSLSSWEVRQGDWYEFGATLGYIASSAQHRLQSQMLSQKLK